MIFCALTFRRSERRYHTFRLHHFSDTFSHFMTFQYSLTVSKKLGKWASFLGSFLEENFLQGYLLLTLLCFGNYLTSFGWHKHIFYFEYGKTSSGYHFSIIVSNRKCSSNRTFLIHTKTNVIKCYEVSSSVMHLEATAWYISSLFVQ